MGFLKSIKNLFPSSKEIKPLEESTINVVEKDKYFKKVDKNLFNLEERITLTIEAEDSWDKFFSVEKENPKLIGFKKRSKKKFRLLFKSEKQIVVYAANTIEVIEKEQIKRVIFKDTPIEKMSIAAANDRNVILRDKEKIAYVNLVNGNAYIYHFDWQPFSGAVGDDYWLIGTRQTYEGPGELYLFDTGGEVKWAISFTEPAMNTMFGAIHVTAYHLKVSKDYSDIFVSSMDKLYRFSPDGELKARLAISELKEEELRKKHEETQRALSTPPKNRDEAVSRMAEQIAEQLSAGFTRLTFHDPFTGFAHDPNKDMVFILEGGGRVTGWDFSGNLVWTISFKSQGRFIEWIDEKLVLSFSAGEILWLDRNGFYMYAAKLPKEASTISPVPNEDKYLIVCEDNRLYELDKTNGKLTPGTTGYPGMELFITAEHHIFFDGEGNKAGYLWLAPIGHKWSIFEKIEIDTTYQEKNSFNVAEEIKETKPFIKLWELNKLNNVTSFGRRIVDFKNQRIYVVERPNIDVSKIIETVKDEEERDKYLDTHDFVCYDFLQNRLWSKRFYNYLFSIILSPDAENLFIGVPLKVNVSNEPGLVVVLNKDGIEQGKIKAPAQGFRIEFSSNDEGIIDFVAGRDGVPKRFQFLKDNKGKWKHGERTYKEDPNREFGSGISNLHLTNFSLKRLDKKKYLGQFCVHGHELKVSAAINEAYEVGEKNLLIRMGNKTIINFDQDFKKIWEVNTENTVINVVLGVNSFIVVSKEEIISYNLSDGTPNWKMATPPKSNENKVHWSQTMLTYIWLCGNEHEYYVATFNENGNIRNSHVFKDLKYNRETAFNEDQNIFIVQKMEAIEAFKLFY